MFFFSDFVKAFVYAALCTQWTDIAGKHTGFFPFKSVLKAALWIRLEIHGLNTDPTLQKNWIWISS